MSYRARRSSAAMLLAAICPLFFASLRLKPAFSFVVPGASNRKSKNNIAVVAQLQQRISQRRTIDTSYEPFFSRSHASASSLWSSSRSSFGSGSDSGEVGTGPNWIERSFPLDVKEADKIDPKKVEDYNLGISGTSFQTGPLSKRMFDVMTSRASLSMSSPEIKRAYKMYALDFTAKEAAKAALNQNGLEMVLTEDEQDEGMWADIDSIRLQGGSNPQTLYDSWEEAVDEWTPGQGFDFIARNVPAKMRELTMDELIQALDPDGTLREQAKEVGITSPEDDAATLKDLANDNIRRVEMSPRGAVAADQAYAGNLGIRGYKPIKANNLLVQNTNNRDEEKEYRKLMHVMDAMVSHGCLLVDLTDGGTTLERAKIMDRMWKTCEEFFKQVQSTDVAQELPGMTTVQETGSSHAKVGFVSVDEGSMQFLETRLKRDSERSLLPTEASPILGEDGIQSLKDSFDMVAEIGKEIVRITVAASTMEAGALDDPDKASEAAQRLANELLDDGKQIVAQDVEHSEGSVSMSPHRLCRYANNKKKEKKKALSLEEKLSGASESEKNDDSKKKVDSTTREVFGAHVDSTFLTIVPVASVAGLEVYDEASEQWYRPELAARQHYLEIQKQQHIEASGNDKDDEGDEVSWHSRYMIMMPGELLQVATRNEVAAAVHRVVATSGSSARLSAPILLRGRPGTIWDVDRYLGGLVRTDSLLRDCDGMAVEVIHDKMQPTSFQ